LDIFNLGIALMRKSLKISSWCGGIAFSAQFIRNFLGPSQETINRMSAFELHRWNQILEPIGLIVAILWIVAIPAFFYGIYRNIIDSNQPTITNIGGHNILAEAGAIVGTDRAEIITGTKFDRSTVTTHSNIEAALAELTRATDTSRLAIVEKERVKLLIKEIEAENNKESPEKDRISDYTSKILNITKDLGPAAESIKDAITIVKQYFGLF